MPLIAEYSWKEKESHIKVSIPTKGVSSSKIDIFVTSSTLKVSFSPYLLEIILLKKIDSTRHKANIINGILTVTLFKAETGFWGNLILNNLDDPELDPKLIKESSIHQHEELEKDLAEKRKSKKIDNERYALRKQMALNEEERNRIDQIKLDEKTKAEKQMYEAFQKLNEKENNKSSNANTNKKSVKFVEENNDELVSNIKSNSSKVCNFDIDDIDDDFDCDDYNDNNKEIVNATVADEVIESEPHEVRYIPPPRKIFQLKEAAYAHSIIIRTDDSADFKEANPKVSINFTPRIFPTPLRESKAAEEEDWIIKNQKHLRKHGVLGKQIQKGNGVDVSQEDPHWLKAKADDFLRSGDIRSACSAYTAALDVDNHIVSCRSNRSICYLKLHQFHDCVDDCSVTIHQINEEMEADGITTEKESILKKALMRRGLCYCCLGRFEDALKDYKEALIFVKVDPTDTDNSSSNNKLYYKLAQDLKRIQILCDADVMKKDADSFFAKQDLSKAMEKYTQVLEFLPIHAGCWSNRSACKLALGDIQGAIDDCTQALAVLEDEELTSMFQKQLVSSQPLDILVSIIPPAKSDKRKMWILKTITRRGVAYTKLNKIDEAIRDFSIATSLDTQNESLKSDLNKLVKLKQSQSGVNRTDSQLKSAAE